MGYSISIEYLDLRNSIEQYGMHRDSRRGEDSWHQIWCQWREIKIHISSHNWRDNVPTCTSITTPALAREWPPLDDGHLGAVIHVWDDEIA